MSKTQTFNDGMVKIHGTTNGAAPGDAPKDALAQSPKFSLRFEVRTVGVNRYYAAMQNKIKVDMLVRCPRQRNVSTDDKAIINDGDQFHIRQVQFPPDVEPPCMDLSLEKVVHPLGFARV
jgi:SPP1 family predicted phage head-tail adaptor